MLTIFKSYMTNPAHVEPEKIYYNSRDVETVPIDEIGMERRREETAATSVREKRRSKVRAASQGEPSSGITAGQPPKLFGQEDEDARDAQIGETAMDLGNTDTRDVETVPNDEIGINRSGGEEVEVDTVPSKRIRVLVPKAKQNCPRAHPFAVRSTSSGKRKRKTSPTFVRENEVRAVASTTADSQGEPSSGIPTAGQPPKLKGRPKRFQWDYLQKAKNGEKPAYEVVKNKHNENHKYLSHEERQRLVVFLEVETEADVVKEFRTKLWVHVRYEVASHQELPERYIPRRNEYMWLHFGDNKIEITVDEIEKMCIFMHFPEYVAEESMEYCLDDIQLFERHNKFLYANRDKIQSLYHLFSSNHFLAWDAQAKLLNHGSNNLSARSVLRDNIEKRKEEDLKLLDLHTLYEYKSKTFEEYLVMNEFIAGHVHDVQTWSSDFIQYVKKKKSKISPKPTTTSSSPGVPPKRKRVPPTTSSRIRCYYHPGQNCNRLRTFMNNSDKHGSIREHWMLYHRDPTAAVRCIYCKPPRKVLFAKEKDYISHLYEAHKNRLDYMDLVPSVVSSYRSYGSVIMSNLTRTKMNSFMQVHCNVRAVNSYVDKLEDIQKGKEGDKLVLHEKSIELESKLRVQNN